MNHRIAVPLMAAVVAITIGVLVGLVIHIGNTVRASARPPAPPLITGSSTAPSGADVAWGNPSHADSSAADPSGESSLETSGQPSGEGLAGSTGSAESLAQDPAGSSSLGSTTPGSRSPAPRSTSQAPLTRTVTVLGTSSSHPITTITATTASPARISTTAATAATRATHSPATHTAASTTAGTTRIQRTTPPGPPTATTSRASTAAQPGRCRPLGAATTIAGVTNYCQHDPVGGELRWRPVVDGGGCLNRTMTGIGTDGRPYVCRLERDGLERWRPAG